MSAQCETTCVTCKQPITYTAMDFGVYYQTRPGEKTALLDMVGIRICDKDYCAECSTSGSYEVYEL